MANQRAEGKRLIGAQASAELWDGVDEWLVRNPGKTVSDFVISALVEKLEREQIEIDQAAVFRDGRARVPHNPNPPKISYLSSKNASNAKRSPKKT